MFVLPKTQPLMSVHTRNMLKHKQQTTNTHRSSSQGHKTLISTHTRNLEKHCRLSCSLEVRNIEHRPCPEHEEHRRSSCFKVCGANCRTRYRRVWETAKRPPKIQNADHDSLSRCVKEKPYDTKRCGALKAVQAQISLEAIVQ